MNSQTDLLAITFIVIICVSFLQRGNSQPCYSLCPTGNNTFVGTEVINNMGTENSFFGFGAGPNNTSGSSNSFFGFNSGFRTNTGSNNSFFGNLSGRSNITGDFNSFFGSSAGQLNTSGSNNSFFGNNSGKESSFGVNNSFFGMSSGEKNTAGSYNTYIGESAGFSNSVGSNNTCIGVEAGVSYTLGSGNTLLGYSAGWALTGISSNNIIIGNLAGPQSLRTVSNKLYIDNKASDTPLIYGDFANDLVVINGTLEVVTGLSNRSSRDLKHEFRELDAVAILEKVVNLDIKEWSYRSHPEQRHIGPIAEEFYHAFSLGKDNKSISTIDANGVALVAIQALYAENEQIRVDNDSLFKQLSSLIERITLLEKKE